jgi:hypothetical protein
VFERIAQSFREVYHAPGSEKGCNRGVARKDTPHTPLGAAASILTNHIRILKTQNELILPRIKEEILVYLKVRILSKQT